MLVKPQLCAVTVRIFTVRDNPCEISESEEHIFIHRHINAAVCTTDLGGQITRRALCGLLIDQVCFWASCC